MYSCSNLFYNAIEFPLPTLSTILYIHMSCLHVYVCSPYASHETQVALREGDLIVAATDGLFSNLYRSDIIAHLKRLKVRHKGWVIMTMCSDN